MGGMPPEAPRTPSAPTAPNAPTAPTSRTTPGTPARLADRRPEVGADALVAELTPPPRFGEVSLQTYRPEPDQPTQARAVKAVAAFGERLAPEPPRRRGLLGLGRRRDIEPEARAGLYLDGGFGVGKTHLLASLWHAAPAPKAYGTFVEITSLVGALGFEPTVRALAGHRLLAIDEFELDDPGDTVLISTLLTRLADAGVRVAATSNTQPEDLGEDRFASEDFLREIQGLAARFETVRVDGEDYRHRGGTHAPEPLDDDEVLHRTAAVGAATCDDFDALCGHLATVHPSRYRHLVDAVPLVGLTGVHRLEDQAVALRVVVLIDRLYDRNVPVLTSGSRLDALFDEELLRGPHRKKYQRALSRLTSLASAGLQAGGASARPVPPSI